jgi:hypothetical protein
MSTKTTQLTEEEQQSKITEKIRKANERKNQYAIDKKKLERLTHKNSIIHDLTNIHYNDLLVSILTINDINNIKYIFPEYKYIQFLYSQVPNIISKNKFVTLIDKLLKDGCINNINTDEEDTENITIINNVVDINAKKDYYIKELKQITTYNDLQNIISIYNNNNINFIFPEYLFVKFLCTQVPSIISKRHLIDLIQLFLDSNCITLLQIE